MAGTVPRRGPGLRGLERLSRHLPGGVEIYRLCEREGVLHADSSGAGELRPAERFLRFIDEGQFAHYFVGDAATSPDRPSNATYKLGVVRPHSAFTPHAHAGEHVVLSLGYAACGLYDAAHGRVVEVPLTPGTLIRIPEMLPHSFANRGSGPLHILAANTGFGIDHEDYAITAAEAERRASRELTEDRGGAPGSGRGAHAPATPAGTTTGTGTRTWAGTGTGTRAEARTGTGAGPRTDYGLLAAALRDLESAGRAAGTTLRERAASRLRRLASALEAHR